MQPSRIGKIILFLLGFFPLFVFILYENKKLTEITFYGLTLDILIILVLTIIVLFLTWYIFYYKTLQSKVFEIVDFENTSAETLNYLITYIIGLLFVDEKTSIIKLGVLLILFYSVYQAGGTYYLQPLLMMIHFKVFKCKIDKNNTIMIISKSDITNQKIKVEELFGNVYLYRGKKDE